MEHSFHSLAVGLEYYIYIYIIFIKYRPEAILSEIMFVVGQLLPIRIFENF